MTLNEFAQKAMETAVYPNRGNNLIYPTLGLAGESGEVAEKVKKIIRDNINLAESVEYKTRIIEEVFDVLWYVAAMSYELGISMEDLAKIGLFKLNNRKNRGTLHGSGDTR